MKGSTNRPETMYLLRHVMRSNRSYFKFLVLKNVPETTRTMACWSLCFQSKNTAAKLVVFGFLSREICRQITGEKKVAIHNWFGK